MNCNEINLKLADLLFENHELDSHSDPDLALHLAGCESCRNQLFDLRATMAMLDTWEVPETNPYFMTRLNVRLEKERQAVPASWLENLRSRFMFSSRFTFRPVAAMAMSALLMVGGGAYLGLNGGLAGGWNHPAAEVAEPQQAAVVHDLQTLDTNAQLLDQLESMSNQKNQD